MLISGNCYFNRTLIRNFTVMQPLEIVHPQNELIYSSLCHSGWSFWVIKMLLELHRNRIQLKIMFLNVKINNTLFITMKILYPRVYNPTFKFKWKQFHVCHVLGIRNLIIHLISKWLACLSNSMFACTVATHRRRHRSNIYFLKMWPPFA